MRKVPVRSLADLKDSLKRDLSDRAKTMAAALATSIPEDIKEASQNRVAPMGEVVLEDDKVTAVIFVPKGTPAAQAALNEEVLGTRPFATVLNRLQSQTEMKEAIKRG